MIRHTEEQVIMIGVDPGKGDETHVTVRCRGRGFGAQQEMSEALEAALMKLYAEDGGECNGTFVAWCTSRIALFRNGVRMAKLRQAMEALNENVKVLDVEAPYEGLNRKGRRAKDARDRRMK